MRLPSASKLDLFAPCDGPWFLDMPTDLPPTGAAAERGKTIHAHLEKGTTPTGEGRTDVLRVRLAEADLPPWIPIDGIACRELVFKWNPATGEALLVGPQSEHPRESWTDRGLFMYGIADHVGRSDKHLLVSDLKTGAVEWLTMPWDGWQTKWLTAVAHKALKWEGNAYACIVSSEAERAWCQEWTPLNLEFHLEFWQRRYRAVSAGQRYLNPGRQCTWCPHRGFSCPLF